MQRHVVVTLLLLVLSMIPVIMVIPPTYCPLYFLVPLGFFLVLPGIVLMLFFVYRKTRRITWNLQGDKLVFDYSLGKIIVPLENIKESQFFDKISLKIRLAGMSIPGLYIGYFLTSLGKAWLLLNKKTGIIAIDLKDNNTVLVSPEKPEELNILLSGTRQNLPEEPPPINQTHKGFYVDSIDKKLLISTFILSIFLFLSTFTMIYQQMPNTVPTHFDSSFKPDAWGNKTTYLYIFILLIGLELFLFSLGYKISKRTPIMGIFLAPVLIGLTLIFVGILYVSVCFV